MITDSTSAPSRLALATAFAIIYLIWGSTFLGILFARITGHVQKVIRNLERQTNALTVF